ncbi:MAG: FAD-dependent monooxygenase [Acidimicrobiales bacterium]|nr:FAD-dependent monooxygenase [Acidimicrobiales bacterium]
MARSTRVAIIGGGLGGLCAASALLRRGHEVHVYEAAPQLMEVGGGLTLGPNAMKALRSIGLEDAVRAIGWSGEHQLTHNWKSGRVLSRTSSRVTAARYGASNCTVHRGELLATFAEALDPDLVTVGARCEAVATEGDVAVARFADGREAEADVVLGADGIRSAVRASLFGPDAPRFTGKIVYRTDPIPVDSVPGGPPSPDSHLWLGPHGAVVVFRVSGGRKINMHAHHDDESYTTESWVTECDRDEVLSVHERWHESLNRLFSVSQVWYKWALYDRDPIPQWSKGRATLLGDAAHPMLPYLGQGVCQAIEDGCVLSAALSAMPDDVPGALEVYERARRPRASRIVLAARAQGVYNHLSSPVDIWKRDLRMRFRRRSRPRSGQGDWIAGYDASSPSALVV